MKIECQDRQIEQLLGNDYFEVPRFQRPYSWETENWEDFWNDIFCAEEGEYFIGPIVVYRKQNCKAIVDGQQRITTITIILACIRDAYNKIGDGRCKNRALGIQTFIERKNKNNEDHFVLDAETSFPYMHSTIQSFEPNNITRKLSEEEKQLEQAVLYFREKLNDVLNGLSLGRYTEATRSRKKMEELDKLRDKLLGVRIIYVELDNEDDAYQVFETLNTRGKNLEISDLIKNHLARLWRPNNNRNDQVALRWKTISENIKSIDIPDVTVDSFIYHYWLLESNSIRRKDIFRTTRTQIKDGRQAKNFIEKLTDHSESYRDVYNPDLRKWNNEDQIIKNSLEIIGKFHVHQSVPLLMVAVYKYAKKELLRSNLIRLLNLVEMYIFINHSLMGAKLSGGSAAMFASHAKTLRSINEPKRQKKVIDEIAEKFKSKLPQDQELERKFLLLRYSEEHPLHKRNVQYVLFKLFSEIAPGTPVNMKEMSIEHIAAQSQKGKFSSEDIASIGNLLYMGAQSNNVLSSRDPKDKLRSYRSIQLPCDEIIKDATDWTSAQINERAKLLFEKFKKIKDDVFGIKISSLF